MASVAEHYSSLLAPIYAWMNGGVDAALTRGAADVADLGPAPATGATAVDLGAGFGAHAIPLARLGYDVVAIDQSAELLGALRRHGHGLSIRTVTADLLDFRRYLVSRADAIVCMGDTLTHLRDAADVARVFGDVADTLTTTGRFLLAFRDYSSLPVGDARFIPVRSDSTRIHTCFLEERPDRVVVSDIVQEKGADGWRLRVSHYTKLRLRPAEVLGMLAEAGLTGELLATRGMVRIRSRLTCA